MAQKADGVALELEARAALDKAFEESRFSKLAAAERGLRTEPAGRKSEATFNHIIDTAAQVLDDVPLRDITTHLIADRAEVNIATLYRYFSDLESILVEFDVRYQTVSLMGIKELAIGGVGLAVEGLQGVEDRRAWIDSMMEAATIMRTDAPGAIGIARDGYAIPQVREITRAAEDVASRMLAIATGFYSPGTLSEDDWYRMYLTVVRATSKILDEACAQRPADLEQIELLKEFASGFFESRFSGA